MLTLKLTQHRFCGLFSERLALEDSGNCLQTSLYFFINGGQLSRPISSRCQTDIGQQASLRLESEIGGFQIAQALSNKLPQRPIARWTVPFERPQRSAATVKNGW